MRQIAIPNNKGAGACAGLSGVGDGEEREHRMGSSLGYAGSGGRTGKLYSMVQILQTQTQYQ